MKKARGAMKLAGILGAALLGSCLLAACSSGGQAAEEAEDATEAVEEATEEAAEEATGEAAGATDGAAEAAEEVISLEGRQLNIYCGAGMADPFQEIADAFQAETGCTMNITFANAAQIQTQIQTAQEGDYFIAGSGDELKPVEEFVAASTPLVKHIPVIAVPADNPKAIAGLADLANADTILIGDPESTPIGKIARKALTDAGLWEDLQARNVLTTTTTAPQIATALANGEGDAGIVWKENVKAEGATILDTPDMDNYVKTIPAARLSFAADAEAADAFDAFLQTEAAQAIWMSYGYELVA